MGQAAKTDCASLTVIVSSPKRRSQVLPDRAEDSFNLPMPAAAWLRHVAGTRRRMNMNRLREMQNEVLAEVGQPGKTRGTPMGAPGTSTKTGKNVWPNVQEILDTTSVHDNTFTFLIEALANAA